MFSEMDEAAKQYCRDFTKLLYKHRFGLGFNLNGKLPFHRSGVNVTAYDGTLDSIVPAYSHMRDNYDPKSPEEFHVKVTIMGKCKDLPIHSHEEFLDLIYSGNVPEHPVDLELDEALGIWASELLEEAKERGMWKAIGAYDQSSYAHFYCGPTNFSYPTKVIIPHSIGGAWYNRFKSEEDFKMDIRYGLDTPLGSAKTIDEAWEIAKFNKPVKG